MGEGGGPGATFWQEQLGISYKQPVQEGVCVTFLALVTAGKHTSVWGRVVCCCFFFGGGGDEGEG